MAASGGAAPAHCRSPGAQPQPGPPLGVYKPRRPHASPLFRLVQDHFRSLQTVYDERFAESYGPWRPVMREVAEKFLACGILEHGFARVRCDTCAHEYLLAFSCKCRYFCTDGGFRPDGTFVSWPAHDAAQLTEAFRRAVLRLFVRRELFDEDQAQAMLQWPHSGFHVHDSVWVSEDDRPFAERLARYCARNPVALERLTYDAGEDQVTYRSDKADGPTAGSETVDPLEFLARVLTHIPDKGQVTQRYYGWYANRTRGVRRRQAAPTDANATVVVVPARSLSRTEAAHRWAELLRQIFEVDPLVCSACGGAMRIVAVITLSAVIDRILTHLRTRVPHERTSGARSPPSVSPPSIRRSGSLARRASRPPQPSARPT